MRVRGEKGVCVCVCHVYRYGHGLITYLAVLSSG